MQLSGDFWPAKGPAQLARISFSSWIVLAAGKQRSKLLQASLGCSKPSPKVTRTAIPRGF